MKPLQPNLNIPNSPGIDESTLSTKRLAIKHELALKNFFERMEFKDVDGATDRFRINGYQVDVCAGHENSLLIIECKMSRRTKKVNLRDQIINFRGKIDALEAGFRKHEKYSKYTNFKYVLASKNIDLRPVDIAEAKNGKRHIWIWTEDDIDYYEDLYSKIREFAKYNLLGELGIKPINQPALRVPASMTVVGASKMYLFFANPIQLLQMSYVARRRRDRAKYYQRLIDKTRLGKIAKYVNEGNILPNNLIVAFDERYSSEIKFESVETKSHGLKSLDSHNVSLGFLEFPRSYTTCHIIDGQHRLYSFANVDADLMMPVAAFENLSEIKQSAIFLDINKFQKKVPPDLVWDLNGDMIPDEPDGIISAIVKQLNSSEPLKRKIYIPSMMSKRKNSVLSMTGLCQAIKKIKIVEPGGTVSGSGNPFYSNDKSVMKRNIAAQLSQYFICLKKAFHEDWEKGGKGFVLSDGGVSIFIRFYENLIDKYRSSGAPKEMDILTYLGPLRSIIISHTAELKKRTTGEGPRSGILKEFILLVREKLGDKEFGGEIDTVGGEEIKLLEYRLKELIKIKMKGENADNWFISISGPEIYGKTVDRLKKNNLDDTSKLYLQLTLGEAAHIIETSKKYFESIFVNSGPHSFDNYSEFANALNKIGRFRGGQTSHFSGGSLKSHAYSLITIYLEKINECLDKSSVPKSYNEYEDED